jgi:glycosyltransferase involved in cell wall biosynthesis
VPAVLASYDVGLAYTPDRPTWHYQPTIKVLEYRALGLPIISTDVASHRQFVEENVNGILCGDAPQAIADAMFKFVANPDFLQQVRINASKMREGCSWLDIAKMYTQNVYSVLLDKAQHPYNR